jgi:hypothetical protein
LPVGACASSGAGPGDPAAGDVPARTHLYSEDDASARIAIIYSHFNGLKGT